MARSDDRQAQASLERLHTGASSSRRRAADWPAIALAAHAGGGSGYAAPRRRSAGAQEAASSAEGQVHHLVFHGRRSQPGGSVRSQAELVKLALQPVPPSFHPESCSPPARDAKQRPDPLPGGRSSNTGRADCGSPTGYPNIAQHVDDMAVIRSCQSDAVNHVGGVCQMNTGSILAGRPSLGAWVTYGLGSAQPQSADLRGHAGR